MVYLGPRVTHSSDPEGWATRALTCENAERPGCRSTPAACRTDPWEWRTDVVIVEMRAWWRVHRAGVSCEWVTRTALPSSRCLPMARPALDEGPAPRLAGAPLGGDELRVRAGLRRAGVVL